jgi:DsbC/DsbD-like thiol-disulfide interchange protein
MIGAIRTLCISLAAAGIAFAGSASQPENDADQPPALKHSRPMLFADLTGVRPGHGVTLAFIINLERGWHTYWNGQNDTGSPTKIELDLPAGWKAGPVMWPAPERYVLPGGQLDHVYRNRAIHLVEVMAPADAQIGEEVTLTLNAEWLVCNDVCLPGWAELSITLPVMDRPVLSPQAMLIDQVRENLPKPMQFGRTSLQVDFLMGSFVINSPDGDIDFIEFYPASDCGPIRNLRTGASGTHGELKLFPVNPNDPGPLRGVLRVRERATAMTSGRIKNDLLYKIDFLPSMYLIRP